MSSTADPRHVDLGSTAPGGGVSVNDLHSRLNPTVVDRIVDVRSAADARAAILAAAAEGKAVCVSGGRHAMGGQQFARGGVLLDTRQYAAVRAFDRERGQIEVESGMQWPELIAWLVENQPGDRRQW
jgi:FAD/FMN-containing dehydrogenase